MARFPGHLTYLPILTIILTISFFTFPGPDCKAASSKQTELFPVYDLIKPNVSFWVNIFTKYPRGKALVHDTGDLSRIYEVIKLNPAKNEAAYLANKETKKKAIEKYKTVLLSLSKGKVPETPLEKKVAALFPAGTKPDQYKLAVKRLRVQTGLKEHFMEGVIRSGEFIDEFKMIFKSYGLPQDLAYLPCLESAYDIQAYSKFGAAGLWQFTHYTGKLFMDINYVVDQRRDPIVSTHGAAKLLKKNYVTLHNWPMAITAYNHGLYGMSRAKDKHKTYPAICKHYKGRTFGFASRNFYPEFIAARHVAKNYIKYYGNITLDKPGQTTRYKAKGFLAIHDLSRNLSLDIPTLQLMNPALRSPVFDGRKYIPPGQILYLPKHITPDFLDKTLASQYHTAQRPTPFHRVVKGDTAAGIAAKYKVPLKELIKLNSLGRKAVIRVGQTLKVPFKDQSPPLKTAKFTKPPRIASQAGLGACPKSPRPGTIRAQAKAPNLPQDLKVVTSNLELRTVHDEKGNKYAIIHLIPGETIANYADWLGIDPHTICKLNSLKTTQGIRPGHEITLPLPSSGTTGFEEKRFEFHQEIIEDFFGAYFIADTLTYTVAPKDTVGRICRKKLAVPFWLLKKFNPDINSINTPVKKGQVITYPLVEARTGHPDESRQRL